MTNLSKAPVRLHRALDAQLAKDTFEVIRANGSVAGEWNTQAEADWHAKTMTKNGLGSFVVRESSEFNNHRCNECGAEANGYATVLGRKEYLCSRHGRKFPTWKATDSVRKAPARLHRALDAVLDARPVRAKDRDEEFMTSRELAEEIGKLSCAIKSNRTERYGGNEKDAELELARLKKLLVKKSSAKDRIPADCLDLGTLALDAPPPRCELCYSRAAKTGYDWCSSCLKDHFEDMVRQGDYGRGQYEKYLRDMKTK
jgi:hypothetical protein